MSGVLILTKEMHAALPFDPVCSCCQASINEDDTVYIDEDEGAADDGTYPPEAYSHARCMIVATVDTMALLYADNLAGGAAEWRLRDRLTAIAKTGAAVGARFDHWTADHRR